MRTFHRGLWSPPENTPQLGSCFRTNPPSFRPDDMGRKNDESGILEKWSCGKVRMLSKHLSQKVFGPYPFLGEFPEKKNNQKSFYWVLILTSPYKGFRVFAPGGQLAFGFGRNPLMQI